MSKAAMVAVAAAAVVVAGCSALSPDQVSSIVETVRERHGDQVADYVQRSLSGGGWDVALEVGRTAGEIALALLGVRLWRGSTTARRGVAPPGGAT